MTEPTYRQLPPEVIEKMTPYREQARQFREQGNFADAEPLLLEAWALIPEPKFSWGDTDSFLYAIVDFYRKWNKHEIAKKWIAKAVEQPLMSHEYVQYLEAGKTYYEAGELEVAKEYFAKAFNIAGARGFNGEDPKYLKFFREVKK
jgi:tetratricopeptide (TPR) repeat protein